MSYSDREQQAAQLKTLIALGKERGGFLTYNEVNEFLSEEIVEPAEIEEYIQMLEEMGITVDDEVAADFSSMIIPEVETEVIDTDEVIEQAAATFATVDAELGRTTDPVRMYMREMGSVELLTRQGEIAIAKRIEEGLREVLMTLAQYPPLLNPIMEEFQRVERGEMKVNELINGFIDPLQGATVPEEIPVAALEEEEVPVVVVDTEEEEVAEVTEGGEFDAEPDLEETRRRFTELFDLMHHSKQMAQQMGRQHPEAQALFTKLGDCLVAFKLVPRLFDAITANMRKMLDGVREHERMIMDICVNKARMPRQVFISSFPNHETSPEWVLQHIGSKAPYSAALEHYRDAIYGVQEKLVNIEMETNKAAARNAGEIGKG